MTDTVVGGSIAALVAADALGAAGRPVRLLLPERGVGGGFAPIRRDGRTLELGVRLHELGFEGVGEPPPLRDYRPGVGAHRPWARTVERWVRDLVGDALREIASPEMVVDGRRVPDLLFSVDLSGLAATLPDGLRRTMLAEVRACRATLGEDAGLLAPRHAGRLAAATLEEASVAQHGPAFHRRYVGALVDKVLDGGASAVAATLRRKAWAPLFHPLTLEQALAGDPIDFRPARPMHVVDAAAAPRGTGQDGSDPAAAVGLVDRLLARIATHPSVRKTVAGDLTGVVGAPGGESLLSFTGRPPLRARRPLIACSAETLFAAAGVPYEVPRVRTVIAWLEADAGDAADVPDLVHVLDPAAPVLRVTRGGSAATPDRALLTVEVRHDAPEDTAATVAADGLRQVGLVGGSVALDPVAVAARQTFAVPSLELQATHAAARRRLDALGLDVDLAAGALSPVADTLNDQVVQGLRAAGRTP